MDHGMEIQRDVIGNCFSKDGDIPPIEYTKYSLGKSVLRVILYEASDGPMRHGYKLLIFDGEDIKEIMNSGTKFYTRAQAVENGLKDTLNKKNIADLVLKLRIDKKIA